MAHNMITTRTQIQARCTVCSSLSIDDVHIFIAAAMLILGLIFSAKIVETGGSSVQTAHLMTRSKVQEAIDLLKIQNDTKYTRDAVQRNISVLESLMNMEETILEDKRVEAEKSPSNQLKVFLKGRIMEVVKGHTESTPSEYAMDGQTTRPVGDWDPFHGLLSSTDESQDFDVLPIISNDLDYDFSQLLDMTPSFGPDSDNFLLERVDWSIPIDPILFAPS